MAQRRWIRLDATWDESGWLDALDGHAANCWPRLLTWVKLRGNQGRVKRPDLNVLARRWRVNPDDVSRLVEAAYDDDAIEDDGGDWVFTNWDTYQDPDPTANERKRRQRSKASRSVTDVTRDMPGSGVTRRATETETETETENQRITDNDSSLRSESAQAPDQVITSPGPNGSDPDRSLTLHQQAMPVLRELGYEAKNHDGSILKAMAKKGLRWETLEPAVRGLAVMRERGELSDRMGISPGEQLSLRILYARDGPKDGAQPIWRVAENRWYQQLAADNRKNRGKMPKLRV